MLLGYLPRLVPRRFDEACGQSIDMVVGLPDLAIDQPQPFGSGREMGGRGVDHAGCDCKRCRSESGQRIADQETADAVLLQEPLDTALAGP